MPRRDVRLAHGLMVRDLSNSESVWEHSTPKWGVKFGCARTEARMHGLMAPRLETRMVQHILVSYP